MAEGGGEIHTMGRRGMGDPAPGRGGQGKGEGGGGGGGGGGGVCWGVGGGGGGHGTVGLAGNGNPAGANGSGTVGGNGGSGGTSVGNGGGGGGTLGNPDLSVLTFGSGGGGSGAGGGSDSGAAGGDGGGIVFIEANSVTVGGSISANGANGVAAASQGGSGGGAGGAIKLAGRNLALGIGIVTTSGGTGGADTYSGGNGGSGRIAIFYSESRSGTTNPGAVETQSGIFPYGLYHSAAIPTSNAIGLDLLRWESNLPANTKAAFQTRSGPAYNTELSTDANTLGLWHMNEISYGTCSGGADACDSSGNGRHGTAVGTTIETINKRFGAAARSFSGVGDYISTPSFGFDYDNITIEAWIYTGNLSSRRTIIDMGANTTLVPQLEIGTCATSTNAVCVITPGVFQAITVNNVISPNTWTHIAYTKSGVGATHKIYVNGVEKSLVTNASADYASTAVAKNIGTRATTSQF